MLKDKIEEKNKFFYKKDKERPTQFGLISSTHDTSHEVGLNHKRQTQKNLEARFPINQLMKSKTKKNKK